MLEQAAQAATQAAPPSYLAPAVVLLAVKALAELGFKGIRMLQERARASQAKSKAEMEEAKTLGIAMVRDRDGNQKPVVVAFCASHIDHEKRITTQEVETQHVHKDLEEIKTDVKAIRVAVSKGGEAK